MISKLLFNKKRGNHEINFHFMILPKYFYCRMRTPWFDFILKFKYFLHETYRTPPSEKF